MTSDIAEAIRFAAAMHQIAPALVAAFCKVESSYIPTKTRYEPLWHTFYSIGLYAQQTGVTEMTERVGQATSWGLMQVMGTRARELGFHDLLPELCKPAVGLAIGCQDLRDIQARFWRDIPQGLPLDFSEALASAYNRGSPIRMEDGGGWAGDYVEKVRAAYGQAKADGF